MEEYFSINSDGHFGAMFSSLHTLQKQGALCDVILAAEDGEVMAHKVLLMAASSYFRERLSQTISGTASRIYLKGISVMELANLVKYIYTGKLFVSKDTVDVTLEISEILGLDGVIKGFNDIIHMQTLRNKTKSEATDDSNIHLSSGSNISTTGGQDCLLPQGSNNTNTGTKMSACGEIHHNSKEIKVLQYNADGSSTTYTVPQSGAAEVTSTTGDGNLEFQQLCQQYVEIPAGTPPHPAQITGSPYAGVPSLETVVIDEQAQHQDLLSVAIKKLSDASSNLDDESTSGLREDNSSKKSVCKKEERYVNGKIDTKIVTLSAGKISNELGGHTSVYTVALDPSTIKQPLKMPRAMRKKTDKEKLAEQNAKRYRQKKAELIAAKGHPDGRTDIEQEHDPVDIYSHQPNIVVQVKDINDQLVVEAAQEVLMFNDSLDQPHSNLRLEPFLNVNTNEGSSTDNVNELFAAQQNITVSEVMVSNHVTVEHCETIEKSQEDFGCSVNFDNDDYVDHGNSKVVPIPGKKDVLNESTEQTEKNNIIEQLQSKPNSVGVETVTIQPHPTEKVIDNVSPFKDQIAGTSLEVGEVYSLHDTSNLESNETEDLQCHSDESPEGEFERLDSDLEKSSASKRKIKAPKRLLSGDDKTTGKNIPVVRIRRSSRNEGGAAIKSETKSQDMVQTSTSGTETRKQDIKQLKSLGHIKSIKVFQVQTDTDKSDKKVISVDESNASDIDVMTDSYEIESDVTNDPRVKKGVKRQGDDQITISRKVLKVEKRYVHDNCKRSFDSKVGYTSHTKECVVDKEMAKDGQVTTRTSKRLSKKSERPTSRNHKSDELTKDVQEGLQDSKDERRTIFRDDPSKNTVEPVEIKEEPNTEDDQEKTSQSDKHECSHCDFFTYAKGALRTHIMLKHDSQKDVIPCRFCEYSTPLMGNLRKHMLSAHHLTVVNKKINTNKSKYKDFEEGTLLTLDGAVFDPKTMPLPKVSNRAYTKEEAMKKRRGKKEKSNLMKLSDEDFTKELLKRHEEYLKQPEKVHKVMSKSLAVATAHPSFPQASPSIRVNKANKLYHTPKVSHSLVTSLTDTSAHYVQIEAASSSIPSVEQEVEIQGQHLNRELVNSGDNSGEYVVTMQDTGENKSEEIVVTVQDNGDGKLIPIQFLLNEDGKDGNPDVVNVLLEEEQIQVHDEVEIQNE